MVILLNAPHSKWERNHLPSKPTVQTPAQSIVPSDRAAPENTRVKLSASSSDRPAPLSVRSLYHISGRQKIRSSLC